MLMYVAGGKREMHLKVVWVCVTISLSAPDGRAGSGPEPAFAKCIDVQ